MKNSTRKRTYERSTPIGRVHKHLLKAYKVASFAGERVKAWLQDGSEIRLVEIQTLVEEGSEKLLLAAGKAETLGQTKWQPPKKKASVTFAVGDAVKICEAQRKIYLQIYDAKTVDSLVVVKLLDTGAVGVSDGNQTFKAPKSHLVKL